MHDRRNFAVLVGGGLLLALLWPTTSSSPSAPAVVPSAPSSTSLAVIEELSHWSRGSEREFGLFGERPLSAATTYDRSRGFALFGVERGQGRRGQLLATLPYGAIIEETADRYRLDSLLLAAVVQAESGFDAAATSPQGARGLMQLMPLTAQSYGAIRPADPRANVRAGARYLRDLLRRFDQDLELALAAYNAGPSAVRRFGGMPPYRETRNYVERVLTLYLGYHRALWQEAQLDQLLGDLPPPDGGPVLVSSLLAPRFAAPLRRSGRAGRAVVVGALAVLPATQPLAEVADALTEPLAELRQPGVAEDQQHDGEDDQQFGDAKASEHGYLRGGGLASSASASRLDFSLADRPAAPATPGAVPVAAPAAPEAQQTIATPAPASAPPA